MPSHLSHLFHHVCCYVLQLRQNQGVSLDNTSTPPIPTFIPPITILIPWCQKVKLICCQIVLYREACLFVFLSFQALTLPSTHQKGKLLALRLICILIVRPHDLQLPKNQLLQFYRIIHNGLISEDHVLDISSFFLNRLPTKLGILGNDQHNCKILRTAVLLTSAVRLFIIDV